MKHLIHGSFPKLSVVGLAGRAGLMLPALFCAAPAHADKIVTKDRQSIEGVIKDENAHYVRIDVKGVLIVIPKERIKEITTNTLEENIRFLLDRAMETLTRGDIAGARTLVEQARAMNPSEQALVDSMNKLDQEISDSESHGGSPEERRQRAEALLQRANEAYDKIKNEEGNQLLIQSLKADPTDEAAHKKINELLSQPEKPDLLLAAVYFAEGVGPLDLRPDSPVIPLLAKAYANLATLFEQSNDVQRSVHYAQLIKALAKGFAGHPSWKEKADSETRALLDKPVDTLFAELIENNLKQANHELAIQKLQGWTQTVTSLEVAKLYLRSYVGAGRLDEALKMLDQAKAKFSSDQDLTRHYNALNLMIQGRREEEKGNKEAAVTIFETIYGSRENLVPELGEVVGRQLAQLRAVEMETALSVPPVWKAPDIASIVMRYSPDPALKRRAAQIIIQRLQVQGVYWKLNITWKINGKKIALPEETALSASGNLMRPLAVLFDPQSPFVVNLAIDAKVDSKESELIQALGAGQKVDPKVPVIGLDFTFDASHGTLGIIHFAKWTAPPLPRNTPAPTPTPQEAAPAPGPMPPGMPGMLIPPGAPAGPGGPLVPPGLPAVPPGQPTPQPTPTPTPDQPNTAAGKPAPTPVPTPAVPAYLEIQSLEDIKKFLSTDLGKYIPPEVTVLASHLSVPMAVDILREKAISR